MHNPFSVALPVPLPAADMNTGFPADRKAILLNIHLEHSSTFPVKFTWAKKKTILKISSP